MSTSWIFQQVYCVTDLRTHNKFGDGSFAVAGPCLWNSLPTSLRQITSYTDNLGDIWKLIYSGIEKSQRSVTYDFLRYINTLIYLLTYLLKLPIFAQQMSDPMHKVPYSTVSRDISKVQIWRWQVQNPERCGSNKPPTLHHNSLYY